MTTFIAGFRTDRTYSISPPSIGAHRPGASRRPTTARSAALQEAGTPIGSNDLWIAAHALALGVPLVSNNTRPFERVPGLRLENRSDARAARRGQPRPAGPPSPCIKPRSGGAAHWENDGVRSSKFEGETRSTMAEARPPQRLLFVCMGNICRSPTAHGVMRRKVLDAGLERAIKVDSAGTHGWHEGDPPDERAVAHARRRGYPIADLRARPLRAGDFERADLLLVMDRRNLDDARAIGAAAHHGKLRLLAEYGLVHHAAEVPDPYYGGPEGFEHVLDLVEDACDGLLRQLAPARR